MKIEHAPLKEGAPIHASEPPTSGFLTSGMLQSIGHFLLFLLAIGTLFAFSVSKAVGLYVLVGGGFALLILYWMAAMLHHQERIDRALNRTDDTKDTE